MAHENAGKSEVEGGLTPRTADQGLHTPADLDSPQGDNPDFASEFSRGASAPSPKESSQPDSGDKSSH